MSGSTPAKHIMQVLFMPRESFPTDRVRINVLFGRELLSRGHRIDLAMQAANDTVPTGEQPWHGRRLWVGPTDSGVGLLNRIRKHFLALRHDFRMLGRARKPSYDALLVSDKFLFAAVAVWLAHRRGLKFIFWLTFPYPELDLAGAQTGTARYPALARLRGRLSAWALYQWILPRSDHVFVQSERMLADMAALGVDARKMSPIVTGFDLKAIVPAAARDAPAGSSGASFTVAYLGTLSADRRLEVLMEMLALLRAGGMAVKLLLIGDADRPRDRQRLEHLAASRGIAEHVEITGFLPQPQALARLCEADIGLSPFYPTPILLSTSPTKLVEYMALGMPVVANDHPEQRLILRESRAGVRVPWGARHFARAVQWLMRLSREERAAMGARGRAWVEANRTYARIADDVERHYLALMNQGPLV